MDGTLQALEMDMRLMHSYQDWLDNQHRFMVQWQQAQDVLVTVNTILIGTMAGCLFWMAHRIADLENQRVTT